MATNKKNEESSGITNIGSSPQAQPPPAWPEKLPREIYFDILSRQSILSLPNCKLVSRYWYNSIRNPLLANMHLKRADEQNLCLLFFSDWPRSTLQLIQVGQPEAEVVKTLKKPFESILPEFEVVGSCNGFICLNSYLYDDPILIYNPFTVEYRELPSFDATLNSTICRAAFGFGFHEKTNQYKVIKIVYYKQVNNDIFGGAPEAFVLTLANGPTWRNIGKIDYDLAGPNSEALVNGNLHWLTFFLEHEGVKYREIVSFDLETEKFHIVPLPSCGGLNHTKYHLVTLRGCLSAVVSCNDGSNEIWMMKEYNVKTSWRKEVIIGNYAPEGLRFITTVPPARRRKNGYPGRRFRVVCELKNGELMLFYGCKFIVSYNTNTEEFKDLSFEGTPLEYLAFVHVGSFVSMRSVFGMEEMRE